MVQERRYSFGIMLAETQMLKIGPISLANKTLQSKMAGPVAAESVAGDSIEPSPTIKGARRIQSRR